MKRIILAWAALFAFNAVCFGPWGLFNPNAAQSQTVRQLVYRTSPPVLPPVEYDHPFAGKLNIVTMINREELRKVCGDKWFTNSSLACASHQGDTCTIYRVPDHIIRDHGWTWAPLLRHEIGHCNGWPGTHPGQRVYEYDR